VLDNRRCYNPATFGTGARCDSVATTTTLPTTTTHNYNNVLLVDQRQRQLITCGSVFQVHTCTVGGVAQWLAAFVE